MPFYSNIENLVLWARSEVVGYAVRWADKNSENRIQDKIFAFGSA